MIGACSEHELQGAWRRPGLRMLSKLPRAIFANNLKLTRELEATLGREVFYTPNGYPGAADFSPPLRRIRSIPGCFQRGVDGEAARAHHVEQAP